MIDNFVNIFKNNTTLCMCCLFVLIATIERVCKKDYVLGGVYFGILMFLSIFIYNTLS